MDLYFIICRALSWGLLIGFFLGGIKLVMGRKEYTEKQLTASKLALAKITGVVKYLTILTLILGLLWCVYFLILGCTVPEQAEYATNMSQLIVSVLTVISIIFAFLEFVRRTDDR
ncbi:transporter [Eisenbergiella sp.]